MITGINSGGQSGVDRAALTVAKELGFQITGWVPKGGWAEDYITPPGVLMLFPELKETPLIKTEQRTVWNVRDSDATLVIVDGVSPGTDLTAKAAETFRKPYLVVQPDEKEKLTEWLSNQNGVLNIGGPRESESPGIYIRTYKLLREVLKKC